MNDRIGSYGFLSYRSTAAERFGYESVRQMIDECIRLLIDERRLEQVRYIPPETASLQYELMLPFEWFELMMFIWTDFSRTDTFVFISSEDYFDSVWTQLEVIGWLAWCKSETPTGYCLNLHDKTFEQVYWPPMEKAGKDWWNHLYNQLRPFAHISRSGKFGWPPYLGEKFSTQYYLLPCRVCGKYSLQPKKYVNSHAKKNGIIYCCHCNEKHHLSQTGRRNDIRGRAPITATPESRARTPLSPLSADELGQLYINKKSPPSSIIDAHY